MNIESLVKLHKQYRDVEFGLKENCGDGYLCEHNWIYRNIRETALAQGTKYRVGGTVQWHDYMVFPLVNFLDIINNNEVPYIDNFNVLRRLSRKFPNISLPEKFIRDSFKRNYVLHETCHCIAHNFLEGDKKPEIERRFSKTVSPKLHRTIKSLLSEALANAVERLSDSVADSSTHILLHVLNSYVQYDPKSHELMSRTSRELGIEFLFKMTFISFFYNNLLRYVHTQENVDLIMQTYTNGSKTLRGKKKKELLSETLYKCCRLNPRFRDETSIVFFSSLGLGDEYDSLSFEKLVKDENFGEYMTQTADEFFKLIFHNYADFSN